MHNAPARDIRIRRLFRHRRLLVVPLDHAAGETPVASGTDHLVGQLAGNGADAVVLHKGVVRHVQHTWFVRTSLIVHLSASTVPAGDPDANYLVATVAEALRLGADAVSVEVNLGSRTAARQVADLGQVADACDRWNLPLLATVCPRGPRVDNPCEPALVAHAAALAVRLGADIVRTPYAGSAYEMAGVVRSCPIPIVVAGGPRQPGTTEILSYADEVLDSGAAGLAMGRPIVHAADPGGLIRQLAERVHREGGGGPAHRPWGPSAP